MNEILGRKWDYYGKETEEMKAEFEKKAARCLEELSYRCTRMDFFVRIKTKEQDRDSN